MSLQEQLNAMKEKSEAGIPAEALQVMHRATEELEKSGILDRVLKVGDRAPQLALRVSSRQVKWLLQPAFPVRFPFPTFPHAPAGLPKP